MASAQKEAKHAQKEAVKEKQRAEILREKAEEQNMLKGTKITNLMNAALSKYQVEQFARNEEDVVVAKVEEMAKKRQETQAREWIKKNVENGPSIIARTIENMIEKHGSKWKPRVGTMVDPKQAWGVWFRLRAEFEERYEEIEKKAIIGEKIVYRASREGEWLKGRNLTREDQEDQIKAAAVTLANWKGKLVMDLLKPMDELCKRFLLNKKEARANTKIFCSTLNEKYNRNKEIWEVLEDSGCNDWKPAHIREVEGVGWEDDEKEKKGKLGKRKWEDANASGDACKYGMKCRTFQTRSWRCTSVHPVSAEIWWQKIDILVRQQVQGYQNEWRWKQQRGGYRGGRGRGRGRGYRGRGY